MDNDTTMRRCSKCRREFPISAKFFIRDASRPGGFGYICKECMGSPTMGVERIAPRDGFKICAKCKQELPATPEYFVRRNTKTGLGSLSGRCKPCLNGYNDTPEELEARRARRRKKRHSETGKAGSKRHVAKRRSEHPEKQAAWNAVKWAIRNGKIPKADTLLCTHCGSQAEHYHHWSYAWEHRLDVIPLCERCHLKVHGQLIEPRGTID